MDLVLKKETARRIVEIKNTNIYTNISVSVICGRKNIVINPAIKITHPIIGIFVLRVFRNRDTLTSLYLDSPFPNESKCSIVFCGTFLKRLHGCGRTHTNFSNRVWRWVSNLLCSNKNENIKKAICLR